MPEPKLRFLVLVKYNAAAWSQLVEYPEDRWKAVDPAVRRCGGVTIRKDLIFQGDYDLFGELAFPDAECAAAFYMAVMAGGAVRDMKIMRMVTIKEGMAVMRKAGAIRYVFFSEAGVTGRTQGRGRTRRRRR